MLDIIESRNPQLVRYAVELHQRGDIPPNTYVVDLDAMADNARSVKDCADALGLGIYVMTKQWNRNPSINHMLAREGLDRFVAVDIGCVTGLHGEGLRLGHVGHLVQIPKHRIEQVLQISPEVWTVYGYDNARLVSEAAQGLGVQQDLLLKVVGPDDFVYPGQEGGIPLDELVDVARQVMDLPGVRVAGTTGFPCVLYDPEEGVVQAKPNLSSVAEGARRLGQELDVEIRQVNCPGTSSCTSMEVVKQHGGTQVEPGNALWGMAPQQLFGSDPGTPAVVFVTEVSHVDREGAYVFGRQFAPDAVTDAMAIEEAFVGSRPDAIFGQSMKVGFPGIRWTYHAWLHPGPGQDPRPGDTAVYFFRPQVFTTSSASIATLTGLSSGKPSLEALYDHANRLVASN